MTFKKGDEKPPTSGRTKGVANKTTQTVRDIFAGAVEDIGGRERLAAFALKNNENEKVFWSLSTKLIPLQMQGEISGALKIIHESK